MKVLIASRREFGVSAIQLFEDLAVKHGHELMAVHTDAADAFDKHEPPLASFDVMILMSPGFQWLRTCRHQKLELPKKIISVIWTADDALALSKGHVELETEGIVGVLIAAVSSPLDDMPVHQVVRPVEPEFIDEPISKDRLEVFRCIIPDVADRDFSLVNWVREQFPDNIQLFVPEGTVRQHLPEPVRSIVQEYGTGESELADLYANALAIVPAPRITDLRVGIVPHSIHRAISVGTPVVYMTHPTLGGAMPAHCPACTSMAGLTDSCMAHLEGSIPPINAGTVARVLEHMKLRPKDFVESVVALL